MKPYLKTLAFLALCSCFLLSTISVSAQFRITKRKHLKGYHIELGRKQQEEKQEKPVKTVISLETQQSFTEEMASVVKPVASSPVLSLSELPIVEHSVKSPITTARKIKSHGAVKNPFAFIPLGAGLKKKLSYPPADPTEYRYAASTGFAFATIATILLGIALLTTVDFIVPMLGIVLVIPALILSIIGMKSDYKLLATFGVVLSAIWIIFLAISIYMISQIDFSGIGGFNMI